MDLFGNFYRHLFRVLPRNEFGFLHDAFEDFVLEDWPGVVRGQHRFFSTLTRRNSQWIAADTAEATMRMGSKRLADLVRTGELQGIFIKTGRHRTECWIKRETLRAWASNHDSECAQYMSRLEAKRALGLKHETLTKVAQAGLIGHVSGSEKFFRKNGMYFLREDVLRIKRAFEKHSVVQIYSRPDELIALRHGLKNYLGRDAGLPAVIRAVVEGTLVPAGHTTRFPGITGYLFRSEDLRKYRPVETAVPPGGFLNFKEAAAVLGTRTEVIRGLVAHGVLSSPNKYQPGLSKLVPAAEVKRFAELYVDAKAIANSANTPIRLLKRHLRESGVPMLEISVAEKGTKVFLRRELEATICTLTGYAKDMQCMLPTLRES
jgi:hypothetical protein